MSQRLTTIGRSFGYNASRKIEMMFAAPNLRNLPPWRTGAVIRKLAYSSLAKRAFAPAVVRRSKLISPISSLFSHQNRRFINTKVVLEE
jgi:hypothetical protein